MISFNLTIFSSAGKRMTSPTKNKLICKENPDLVKLQELNVDLHKNLVTALEFLLTADVKHFVKNPNNLSILHLGRKVSEDIEKFLTTSSAHKIQSSLHQWQTELIFHYNRLLIELKNQRDDIKIGFLNQNFSVELMPLIPLTPRKSARLQARGKGSSPKKEEGGLDYPPEQLPHYKTTVARRLKFDVDSKSESPVEHIVPKPKVS